MMQDNYNDNISTPSLDMSDVYDHLQKCKYCRSQINQKMKQSYAVNAVNTVNGINPVKKVESFNTDSVYNSIKNTFCGYEFREIIIIILVGIIIIFILDLFVKIGRKTNKFD